MDVIASYGSDVSINLIQNKHRLLFPKINKSTGIPKRYANDLGGYCSDNEFGKWKKIWKTLFYDVIVVNCC